MPRSRRRRRRGGRKRYSKGHADFDRVFESEFLTRFLGLTQRQLKFRRPYAQNPWVYAAISSWARNMAQCPWMLVRGAGRDAKEIESHPVLDLLNRPNPEMDGGLLKQAMAVQLGLCGRFVLVKESGTDGRVGPRDLPRELWPVWPSLMKPQVDKRTKLIDHWIMEVNGQRIRYERHEVIYHRFYNPYDFYGGLSPIEAISIGLESDWRAGLYNLAFFENNADPGGVLQTDEGMSSAQRKRMLEDWEQRHKGDKRAQRVAILVKGLKYVPFSTDRKKMQYLELRTYSRKEVQAVTGVPPIEMGVYDEVNYGTADTQRRLYWVNTLKPIQAGILATLNGAGFVGGITTLRGAVLAWDHTGIGVLQEDLGEKSKQARVFFSMGVPFNEINKRLRLGFPELEGGDTGYLPSGLVPARMVETGELAQARAAAAPDPEPKRLGRGKSAIAEKVFRDAYGPAEKRWKKGVAKYFGDLRADVLQRFDEIVEGREIEDAAATWADGWLRLDAALRRDVRAVHGATAEPEFAAAARDLRLRVAAAKNVPLAPDEVELINVARERWDAELAERSQPLYRSVTELVSDLTDNELGGFVNFGGAQDPAVLRFVANRVPQMVEGVNSTVALGVRTQVLAGLADSETVDQLRRRINGVFDAATNRSLVIARTEVGIAGNGTRFEAFRSEQVEQHEWITSGDDEVRDSHRSLHGEVVNVGQRFSNGLRFPQDPEGDAAEIISCRCVAVAAT